MEAAEGNGRRRPFFAKPIFLFTAVFLIFVASGAIIVLLRDHSAAQANKAVQSDELSMDVQYEFVSAWRAVLGNQPQPAYVPADQAAQEAKTSLALFKDAKARYDLEAAEGNQSSVRAEIEALAAQLSGVLTMLENGQTADALTVMGTQINDPFYVLAAHAQNVAQSYADTAARDNSLAQYGTIAIFVLSFLVIALAYWRYRRIEHASEARDVEHEILRRSEARFRPLVQSSADAIAVVNSDLQFTYASPAIRSLTGLTPEEIGGRSLLDSAAPEDRRSLESLLESVKSRANYTSSIEMRLDRVGSPDATRYVELACTNRLLDPDVNGFVLNLRDVTERKALESQLRHQAFHDSLTGLANRLRFMDRLEHSLMLAKRSSRNHIGVLFMDLDFFKNVNDELGHTTGDALLKQVAQRIQNCIRATDTAARLGGDEYAILLEDAATTQEARNVAGRILDEMNRPFLVDGHELNITASIGVVFADSRLMSAEEVLRSADVAMYDAKENGRNRVHVYEADMQLGVLERVHLINELNTAVEKNQFLVYYQPTIDLETERITGFEALVRWEHPTRGLLHPDDFISIAEETGAIQGIGKIVLWQACAQAKEWQDKFPTLHDCTMSVNVSGKQIQRPGLVDLVRQALDESGLDPTRLTIEVTESVLLPQPQKAIETLLGLKALGVQIALDDFGTGYSSLSYLKRFPIDILKIDRIFIEGLDGGSEKDKLLVQTVIDLGSLLNLHIVAEGIERKEQLDRLRALHCDVGQGFFFAEPLDAVDAETFLRQQAALPPPAVSAPPPGDGARAAAA